MKQPDRCLVTWAVTGHRPAQLGGYTADVAVRLRSFAASELRRVQPDRVITGMALGWDQAIAAACIELSIPFIAAVPCHDYDCRWPRDAQREYLRLCHHAQTLVIVSPGPPAISKLFTRNEWMIAKSQRVLALWNSNPHSGTGRCVAFAKKHAKPVDNAWDRWLSYVP